MADEGNNKLCPSSTCHDGALLLGVVQGDQKVALLNPAIPINNEFIDRVNNAGSPENRFRFAGKCAKSGCGQWTGKSCGIMNELSAANPALEVNGQTLPECSIRNQCRWYSQEGAKACFICPFVITQAQVEENTTLHKSI